MKARSILITGGAGFFGTHLARAMVRSPGQIRVVSLDIKAPSSPVPGVHYFRHDVRRPFTETLSEHFDVVFNLAAVHRTPGHADHEYYETNLTGAVQTVDYCDKFGVRDLVFTSSIAVYGSSEEPKVETSPLQPTSAYGKSKLKAEDIHRAWVARASGRRLRIVRPAVTFGKGENGNFTRLVKLMRKGLFIYVGRTDTRKASGYVKELVSAIAFSLNRPEAEYMFNFATSKCPTIKEICDSLFSVGHVRRPLGVVPIPLIYGAARGFELLNAWGL